MSSGTTLNALTFTLYGSQKEKREKGPEKVFEEIVTENFTKLEKEVVNQVQEVQRALSRINSRRNTPTHIVIQLTKIKY